MNRDVARLLGMGSSRRPGSEAAAPVDLRPGIVTRVDPSGDVWVTPVGGDARSPLGPCRGATRPALVTVTAGTYRLDNLPLPARTPVLFAVTADGVWIVTYDTKGFS